MSSIYFTLKPSLKQGSGLSRDSASLGGSWSWPLNPNAQQRSFIHACTDMDRCVSLASSFGSQELLNEKAGKSNFPSSRLWSKVRVKLLAPNQDQQSGFLCSINLALVFVTHSRQHQYEFRNLMLLPSQLISEVSAMLSDR